MRSGYVVIAPCRPLVCHPREARGREPRTSNGGVVADRSVHQSRTTIAQLVTVVVVILLIQLALPDSVTIGPLWLIPLIELSGIPIVIAVDRYLGAESRLLRVSMNSYLVFLVAACVMNAVLLLITLLRGTSDSGTNLLLAGFGVLIINVLSFGLVYWWLDGGGPNRRLAGTVTTPDFLFPQQALASQASWKPGLIDYLFTAYTNIIAFSPTDTMPLTHRVKLLFTLQSSTAVLTIVVTLSRAINLIPGGQPGS